MSQLFRLNMSRRRFIGIVLLIGCSVQCFIFAALLFTSPPKPTLEINIPPWSPIGIFVYALIFCFLTLGFKEGIKYIKLLLTFLTFYQALALLLIFSSKYSNEQIKIEVDHSVNVPLKLGLVLILLVIRFYLIPKLDQKYNLTHWFRKTYVVSKRKITHQLSKRVGSK